MREVQNNRPFDTLCTIKFNHYKIGVHGFVFMWLNDQWTRSTKSIKTILKCMAADIEIEGLNTMRQPEHVESVRLMRWAQGAELKWPCLKWLYHIPNGGMRNKAVAGKLKAEGVKAGVADYFLPWPMGGTVQISDGVVGIVQYHGLYLELKAPGKTYPTYSQRVFLADMAEAGYAVAWRRGASDAIDVITAYLEGTWENGLVKMPAKRAEK